MAVREARQEILASPLPTGRGPFGCLGVVAGILLLLGWPAIRPLLPGGDFASPFVVLAGVVFVAFGVLSMLRTGRTSRAAAAAVEAAMRQLEGRCGDGRSGLISERDVDLRAAVLLVSHAFVSDGPTTVRTFDPSVAAERLGGRLALVLAVQEALEEELGEHVPFAPGL